MSSNKPVGKFYRTLLKKTYEWRRTAVGRTISAPLRGVWDGLYRAILSFKKERFSPFDTILVSGSPRSGTTWLSELLALSRQHCVVFEPIVSWQQHGIIQGADWARYISPDREWPEGKQLFSKLFQGECIHPHAFVHNSASDLLQCTALVIKSINTNKLLPWLTQNFQIRGIVLIIRHPCAVVASLKKHLPKCPRRIATSQKRYVHENLPHLANYVEGLQTEEELLAVRWCCDQHPPLTHRQTGSWIQVSYEKVVLDGPEELRRIHSALDLPRPKETNNHMRSASQTAHNWSVDHSRASVEERLSKWQLSIDVEQSRRILSVVKNFGIQGFGEDVVPDFENIGVTT